MKRRYLFLIGTAISPFNFHIRLWNFRTSPFSPSTKFCCNSSDFVRSFSSIATSSSCQDKSRIDLFHVWSYFINCLQKQIKNNYRFFINIFKYRTRARLSRAYRLDRQCCGLRHCPHGQCLFFPIFPQLLAWAKLRFRVDSGQCRITAAILPEALSTWTMPFSKFFSGGYHKWMPVQEALSNTAKLGFRVDSGQCRITAAILPEGWGTACSKRHCQIHFCYLAKMAP